MSTELIWAPWREGFVLGKSEKGCVFCKMLKTNKTDDRDLLILKRGRHNFIVMNKFPYTSGHLLVVPNRHIGAIEKLSDAEANEHYKLVRLAAYVLKLTLRPHGMNIGMNLERVAGAGVLDHVHTHLVPRWTGDSNFMPVIGQARVQSVDLEPMYDKLLATFKKTTKLPVR